MAVLPDFVPGRDVSGCRACVAAAGPEVGEKTVEIQVTVWLAARSTRLRARAWVDDGEVDFTIPR